MPSGSDAEPLNSRLGAKRANARASGNPGSTPAATSVNDSRRNIQTTSPGLAPTLTRIREETYRAS